MRNWKTKLNLSDFYHLDSMLINKKGLEMAKRIRKLSEHTMFDDSDKDELEDIAQDFEYLCGGADDVESFDYNMERLYDFCDAYKVWVVTRC